MRRLALVLTAAAALLAPSAAHASGDSASVAAYVRADYRMVHELVAELPVLRRQPPAVQAEVRSNCPGAGAGSPQDGESTLLSDEVIGALVIRSDRAVAGPIHRFLRAVRSLRWRSRGAAREVGDYVHSLGALARLPYPSLCGDVRSWAAGGFASLSPFTRSFAPRFMELWVAPGEQPPALVRLEGGSVRALGRRAAALEAALAEWEAQAVETYTGVMNALAIYP